MSEAKRINLSDKAARRLHFCYLHSQPRAAWRFRL